MDILGNVVHEESRYSYGLERNSTNNDPTAKPYYSYTGKEYDEETGLVYFGGRYYSPELGRWITPDPLPLNEIKPIAIKIPKPEDELKNLSRDFGNISGNLYGYVDNNPTSRIDPWGLASLNTNMEDRTTTFDPWPEDPHGEPYTIETRNDVTSNARPGAQDAFETEDVRVVQSTNNPSAYGPNGAYIDTGDPRGRDIHGGGTRFGPEGSQEPRQGWAPTLGCTRGQNEDVIELGGRIQDFQIRHPDVEIPYTRR